MFCFCFFLRLYVVSERHSTVTEVHSDAICFIQFRFDTYVVAKFMSFDDAIRFWVEHFCARISATFACVSDFITSTGTDGCTMPTHLNEYLNESKSFFFHEHKKMLAFQQDRPKNSTRFVILLVLLLDEIFWRNLNTTLDLFFFLFLALFLSFSFFRSRSLGFISIPRLKLFLGKTKNT